MNTLHTQHAAGYGGLTQLVLVMAVLLAWTGPAAGQGAQDATKDHYSIRIFRDGITCRYVIEEEKDQDNFQIRSNGTIAVYTDATAARVHFSKANDDTGPVKGSRVKRVMAGHSLLVQVRAPLSPRRATTHVVAIQCCSGFGASNECLDAEWAYAIGEVKPEGKDVLPGGPRMTIED